MGVTARGFLTVASATWRFWLFSLALAGCDSGKCKTDEECRTTDVCRLGACVTRCIDDRECSTGQACIEGACTTDWDTGGLDGQPRLDGSADAGDASDVATDASDATTDAGDATTDAGDAETDAGDAETDAATDAGDATTDAGDAMTDAGDATTDAGDAETDAGDAATDAGDAETDAGLDTGPDGGEPPAVDLSGLYWLTEEVVLSTLDGYPEGAQSVSLATVRLNQEGDYTCTLWDAGLLRETRLMVVQVSNETYELSYVLTQQLESCSLMDEHTERGQFVLDGEAWSLHSDEHLVRRSALGEGCEDGVALLEAQWVPVPSP